MYANAVDIYRYRRVAGNSRHVLDVVGVRVADAVIANAFHELPIGPPIHRLILERVIRWVMNATRFTLAGGRIVNVD